MNLTELLVLGEHAPHSVYFAIMIMIMMHMLELLTRKLELAVGCMDVDVSGSCDGSTNCTLMSMSTDLVWIVLVSVLVQASERAIPSPSPSRSGGFRHGTSCTCTCTCTRPEASTFIVRRSTSIWISRLD